MLDYVMWFSPAQEGLKICFHAIVRLLLWSSRLTPHRSHFVVAAFSVIGVGLSSFAARSSSFVFWFCRRSSHHLAFFRSRLVSLHFLSRLIDDAARGDVLVAAVVAASVASERTQLLFRAFKVRGMSAPPPACSRRSPLVIFSCCR